jgi:iron(III) transport system permease protein
MATAYGIVLMILVFNRPLFIMRAIRESQKFYTITGEGVRPRTIEKGKWRYVTTMIVFAGHFDPMRAWR